MATTRGPSAFNLSPRQLRLKSRAQRVTPEEARPTGHVQRIAPQ